MPLLAAAFSILAALAGLYYLIGSRSAGRLGHYESHVLNRKRIKLRRVGGAAMLVLGIAFFVGSLKSSEQLPQRTFMALWLLVMLMLLLIVILAAADVRLTYRIYHGREERQEP